MLPLSPSSINWYYWQKLGAEQHSMRCTVNSVHGLSASAGVWLRATETEISATICPLWLGKDFSVKHTLKNILTRKN